MKYLVILEPTETGYSAYSPDLEGCVAAGDDRDETIALCERRLRFTWRAWLRRATPSRLHSASPPTLR
jgi:hypothetical protein